MNAVLDAFPMYMLTLFPIPAGARKQEKKGIPSGKMESYDYGKKQGGLGFKSLKNQSNDLKLKW